MIFQELNNDQRRETVNTRQRYTAFREARDQANANRGSLVWAETKGHEYLVRSYYDKAGFRKQTSLGARSPETEKLKSDYERRRTDADARLKEIRDVLARQAAINRVIGLARVPLIGARIIRAIDTSGMLGAGIRVLGTNAMYAYEAAAGVQIDPGLATTEDIDLLFDSRGGLTFVANDEVSESSLLQIIKKVDHSFQRSTQTFRAVNRDGYLVDLIKPMRNPPWKDEPETVGSDPDDLTAIQIEGLAWLESAPQFEAIATDERGEPLRIVAPDPRVWAAHKLWLSKRDDREPIKRRRDEAQARAVGSLVSEYLPNLPFEQEQLRMLPKKLFDEAAPLFVSQSRAPAP
jgi:hypothetical protein